MFSQFPTVPFYLASDYQTQDKRHGVEDALSPNMRQTNP